LNINLKKHIYCYFKSNYFIKLSLLELVAFYCLLSSKQTDTNARIDISPLVHGIWWSKASMHYYFYLRDNFDYV